MTEEIYLDYAATTPLDPRVRESMVQAMGQSEGFGNPASLGHSFGRQAANLVQAAADQVAGLLNAKPEELVWTSGATEADNLAIIGAAQFRSLRGRHVVTTSIEHKAVLESCVWLESQGFTVTYLQPDRAGCIVPAAIEAALTADTTLVSVMHANNETGAVQDIAAIGEICRRHDVLFHVDAAQSLGKLPIDVKAMPVDMLSLNAHKACGPKGVGALYLNTDRVRRVSPLFHGGGQQRGIRPGTLPVHQIVGLGETARILQAEMADEVPRIAALRDQLWSEIKDIPGVQVNADLKTSLCSILNVSVAGVEGESLRFALPGLAVSSGAACNSSSGEPSYVLRSLGLSDTLAEASLRFSCGRFTTADEIAQTAELLRPAIAYLQSLADVGVAAG